MDLKKLTGAIIISSLLFSCGTDNSTKKKTKMKDNKAIELSNMETSVPAGTDFFVYSNGGWLKRHPIPEEYSQYGSFQILDKKSKEQIKSIISEISELKDLKKGTPEQQIRDFYKAGMDTATIDKLGAKPILPLLKEIQSLKNIDDIFNITLKLNKMGMYTSFYLFASIDDKDATRYIPNLNQGGLGLPDRDYYLGTDEHSKSLQKQYIEHISNMFVLVGNDKKTAQDKAKNIYAIEEKLAEASMSRLEQRDPNAVYNIFTIEDIAKKCKHFNMAKYIKAIGLTDIKEVNVRQPKFFMAWDKMMADIPVKQWADFIEWKVLHDNASLLSQDFVNENFAFYGTTLSGMTKMQERWKRMINSTNSSLGEAVGQMYVEKYFPAEAKDKMLDLVGNLRVALKSSIENLDWMSEETKVRALEKLAAINLKVGYPNKWKDYSSIKITNDNYVQNVWNAGAFAVAEDFAKIGKPIDKEEWGMTPQTVNAYYSPNRNEIVFPAAILQAPFFSLDADDAVNYGAIGVVIGHEMTHGFDDQGRKYDKNGNLNDWWTAEDAKKFKEKTQLLVEQFDKYVVLDSLHINGKLTLGENIADNGGLFIAYKAMQMANPTPPADIDGLTYQQRFFISYAQVWRQNIRDKELTRRLKEDVHSPGEARVNAGVVNVPYWYEAFNIKESDPLFVPVKDRAKIW